MTPSLPRKVAGFALLGLAVLWAVLPILQAILFIALGLFILRDQYGWAREGMDRLRARWPNQIGALEATEARLIAWSSRQVERLLRHLP